MLEKADNLPLANKRLKVAVIGLGKQALEDHIPALLAIDDIELVAVADMNKEKLDKFLAGHPLKTTKVHTIFMNPTHSILS